MPHPATAADKPSVARGEVKVASTDEKFMLAAAQGGTLEVRLGEVGEKEGNPAGRQGVWRNDGHRPRESWRRTEGRRCEERSAYRKHYLGSWSFICAPYLGAAADTLAKRNVELGKKKRLVRSERMERAARSFLMEALSRRAAAASENN